MTPIGRQVTRGTAIAALAGLAACATVRQITALRQVHFDIDRVAGIRLAGVNLDGKRRASDVSPLEAARIGAAVLRGQVPLAFDIHIEGTNPPENGTTARLVRFDWTLDLNGRETVSGTLDTAYTFPPGMTTDVRLPIQMDVAQVFQHSGQDLLDLALGLAGIGTRETEVVVRAVPTIDTPLGGIRYPNAITIVKRTVRGN